MAFKIAFLCGKGVNSGVLKTFELDDGVKYEVTLEINWDLPYHREISVSWKSPSENGDFGRLLTMKLYLSDNTEVSYDQAAVLRCRKGRATFKNIKDWEDCEVLVVVEIIELHQFPPLVDQSLKELPMKKSVQLPSQPITITRPVLLGACMNKVLETGEFSDVTLSDGTTDIKAHKIVLSVHSSVFAKMFQNPMKESLESKVLIEDIPMDVLKIFLNFMYSDGIEVSDRSMVRELYIASEKYDVKILRDSCSDVLKSMDITNVIDTLLLADLHSDEVLKHAALDFIIKHFSELKAMQDWKNLMKENQAMYLEALSYVVHKKL